MFDEKKLRELETLKKDWEETCLKPSLDVQPERKEKFITDIGLTIERDYTPLDLERIDFDYKRDLGFPGQYPFTRGITPQMYRGVPWIIRAYSGFGEPKACNQRYKKLVEWGGDDIETAVDLPTQGGYDSDHTMAGG